MGNETLFGIDTYLWQKDGHFFNAAARDPFLPVRFSFEQATPSQDIYYGNFSFANIPNSIFTVPDNCVLPCQSVRTV